MLFPQYSDPPPLRPFQDDKPTLLVCWWITIFCTLIILLRVAGRFIRSEKLFIEDKTAALAIIPLLLRMGCVQVILVYGTNNAALADAGLSPEALSNKQTASGLVLFSRILYAATLWILKSAILEFFKRLNANWQRSYGLALLAIRCTLIATFVAVIVADLAECRPFFHYWQVLPDPGPQCRQGFAQLITMATCNVFTDLLLVFFPIPIIIQSQMGLRRKIQLVLLFSLSLGPVVITLYRVPHIVWDHGSQQSRSLYASVEILFATVAANALVLGSFVRDRGVKKQKFKYGSVAAGSMERSSGSYSRRPTAMRHWGSDVDLVRDVGFGVDRDLQEVPNTPDKLRQFSYAPAPAARLQDMRQWDFPSHKRASVAPSDDSYLSSHAPATRSNSTASPTRKVSFFDVGGLLEEDAGLEEEEELGPTAAPRPPRVVPASTSGFRRGSSMVLQDVGGLLSVGPKSLRTGSATPSEIQSNKQGARDPASPRETTTSLPIYDQFANQSEPELKDPGGLLG